jgi:hypothetical protein
VHVTGEADFGGSFLNTAKIGGKIKIMQMAMNKITATEKKFEEANTFLWNKNKGL